MSGLSKYFNAQAAAPSWRFAKYAAASAGLSVLGILLGGPVAVDLCGWMALTSAVASAGAALNAVRRGFFAPTPRP